MNLTIIIKYALKELGEKEKNSDKYDMIVRSYCKGYLHCEYDNPPRGKH